MNNNITYIHIIFFFLFINNSDNHIQDAIIKRVRTDFLNIYKSLFISKNITSYNSSNYILGIDTFRSTTNITANNSSSNNNINNILNEIEDKQIQQIKQRNNTQEKKRYSKSKKINNLGNRIFNKKYLDEDLDEPNSNSLEYN